MGAIRESCLLQANRNGFFYVLDRPHRRVPARPGPSSQKLTWASGIWSRTAARSCCPATTPRLKRARRRVRRYAARRTGCPPRTSPVDAALLRDGGRELLRVSKHHVRRCPRRKRGSGTRSRRRCTRACATGAWRWSIAVRPSGWRFQSRRSRRRRDDGVARALFRYRPHRMGDSAGTAGGVVFYGQASGEFAAVDAKLWAQILAL